MPEIEKVFFPKCYDEKGDILKEYLEKEAVIVCLAAVRPQNDAKRLKDYFLGFTFSKGGFAFQWGKRILFSMLKKEALTDTVKLSSFLWRKGG
jgi:FtsZ-interacting cell division protein YlmF